MNEIDKIRAEIIKEMFNTFGTNDLNLMAPLKRGENLAEYLREKILIYPNEYEMLMNLKTSTFQEVVDSASTIKDFIARKRKCYKIYSDYVCYFLGERVSSEYAEHWLDSELKHLSLKDEDGSINYIPYLEMLGITNIDDLHHSLKDIKNNSTRKRS